MPPRKRTSMEGLTVEEIRLREAREGQVPWRFWGPYLSERQWGTVREDYSENGDAWDYFSHDQARSRAYHWGEDGLAGFSDDHQRLCFSRGAVERQGPDPQGAAVWPDQWRGQSRRGCQGVLLLSRQHADPLLHEVSLQVPAAAYPYDDLVETNRRRGRNDMEYELLDTGVFNDNRYFDVFVEYAKAAPDDILIRITPMQPRAADAAAARPADPVVPQHLDVVAGPRETRRCGEMRADERSDDRGIACRARRVSACIARAARTCCSPKTRPITSGSSAHQRRALCQGWDQRLCRAGRQEAVNPNQTGTKAAAHYRVTWAPGKPR